MKRPNPRITPASAWLLLVLLLYVALWTLSPQELTASDPWVYSTRAFKISQHFDLGPSDVFSHRLAVTFPVALAYALFGVNLVTTHLWPLGAALLVVLVVWAALPDDRSRSIGAALCLTGLPLFTASTALLPDIIATALMASSTLVLFNRRRLARARGIGLLAPLTATSLLFLAFLAKESAYWVLPLWVMAFVADVKEKDSATLIRRFHLCAVSAGVVLGIGYLVFCHLTWGNPLARLESIQALSGAHLWSWDKASSWDLLKRLTVAPVRLLRGQYGEPVLLLALFALPIMPRPLRPWGYYTACCLLFFWFGSTSLTRYEPMPLFERMTLPALPGLSILAAFTTARLAVHSERAGWVTSSIPVLLMLGLTSLPFVQYVNSWRWQESAEAKAVAIIQKELQTHPTANYLLVCSDPRSPESLAFYFGYHYPATLHVSSVAALTDAMLQAADKRFVFVHRERSGFLTSAYGYPNYDNELASLGLTPVYKAGYVELYSSEAAGDLSSLVPASHRPNTEPQERPSAPAPDGAARPAGR